MKFKLRKLFANLLGGDVEVTVEEVNEELKNQKLQLVSSEKLEELNNEIKEAIKEKSTDGELQTKLDTANKAIEAHAKVVEDHEAAVKTHEEVAGKLVTAEESVATLTTDVENKDKEIKTSKEENEKLTTRNGELAKQIKGKPQGSQNNGGGDDDKELMDQKEFEKLDSADQIQTILMEAKSIGASNGKKKDD